MNETHYIRIAVLLSFL